MEAEANVKAIDKIGYTAVIYAADSGRADTVKVLLDAKANVEAANSDGMDLASFCCY